jgi:glutaconate CoA-transferase subunit A
MSIDGKLMTSSEAIGKFVSPGISISLGGFTVNRNPMALVHEIIRQEIGNLHVMMHSGSQALDLLIGAGLVNILEIAYGANGRFAPTCVRFRKAVQEGILQVEDYTNFQMSLRFLAGAMGVPYLPTYTGLGSDISSKWGLSKKLRQSIGSIPNEKLIVTSNPFRSDPEQLVIVPAATPDVTLLHVQQASEEGIIRIEGLAFADIEQARAAKHVIVTCEELVASAQLRKESCRNGLPHLLVDSVVHHPYGAHPTACFLYYDYDATHLNDYRSLAEDDDSFETYLTRHIKSLESFHDYVKLIGTKHLSSLLACKELGYARRGH